MLDGQIGAVEHLVAVEIGDGHFGRRDEEEVALLDAEGVLLELRKLAGGGHGGAVDQLRREDLDVSVLANVQVHHEVEQRALEPGAGRLQKDKARTCHLHGALEINDAEPLGDFVMRPHCEGRWFATLDAPGAHGHVAGGVFPFRHRVVGRVGDFEKQRVEPGSDRRNSLLQGLDLIPQEA